MQWYFNKLHIYYVKYVSDKFKEYQNKGVRERNKFPESAHIYFELKHYCIY